MEVSMDGLRRNAIRAFNGLVKEIKYNIKKGEGHIEEYDVDEYIEDLRNVLVTLCCSYQEGEGGWKELENFEIESLTDKD